MTREVRVRSPPPEPRITLKVGGQPVTFLVDTGAQHSVLTQNPGPLSDKSAWVQGATGGKRYRWTTDRKVHLATGAQVVGPMGQPLQVLTTPGIQMEAVTCKKDNVGLEQQ